MCETICDLTAFNYWRTPPIVRLLACGPEEDELLRNMLDLRRLREFREELAQENMLVRALRGTDLRRANYGPGTERIKALACQLAPSTEAPVELLVHEAGKRRRSKLVHPHVWGHELPPGTTIEVGEGVCVVTPEFALLELAARTNTTRVALLAAELCGGFACYKPPASVRKVLQELVGSGRLPVHGGWSPALDQRGRLTTLWTRPPLCGKDELTSCANGSGSARGRERLLQAAGLVHPGAASPFEVQAGVLLGWDPSRGGEGYSGLEHNHRVNLSPQAQRVARRAYCSCDLYWGADGDRAALDVECQSAQHHAGSESALSDADRASALQLEHTNVLGITFRQLTDRKAFEGVSTLVAERLGREVHVKTAREERQAEQLRKELFVDWTSLPCV